VTLFCSLNTFVESLCSLFLSYKEIARLGIEKCETKMIFFICVILKACS